MKSVMMFVVIAVAFVAGCASPHSRVMKQMKEHHEEMLKAMEYKAEEIKAAKEKGLPPPLTVIPASSNHVVKSSQPQQLPALVRQTGPTYVWQTAEPALAPAPMPAGHAARVIYQPPLFVPGWERITGYPCFRVVGGRTYAGSFCSGGRVVGSRIYSGTFYAGSSVVGGRNYSGGFSPGGQFYTGGKVYGGATASGGSYIGHTVAGGPAYTGARVTGGNVRAGGTYTGHTYHGGGPNR